MSGVLSQTKWMNIRGPEGNGNEYFRELQYFFSYYKNHKAIEIANELIDNGFTFDAPLNFILGLSEIPNLDSSNGYSDYLIERAKGEAILEDFRLALIDLERKSNFKENFFNNHKSDYQRYIRKISQNFNADEVLDWMNNFYGYINNEYHLILAPAMFPLGGYAVTIEKNNGDKAVYEIIRASESSNEEPDFGNDIFYISLHEWGHSYVNPVVKKNISLINKYNLYQLYKPVEDKMIKQHYGSTETFLNEQIIRGINNYKLREQYKDNLKYETERGFYLTEFTTEQIEYYQKHRDKFKSFDDFIPYLLKKYYENKNELLKNL
ncbi:hypothetical protein BHF71_11145 [Vulcanibacillus modesticaldus]|uniref:DUF4932 domain-containing protein n=1 Tax=Vulcanibacillus modesticaldus TaxID=337097 RepID=A0A1D2YSM2_9BACI|nr:hypothetical protein BHF71_11145 [Vulcanibacillus modesticaldus]